MNEREEKRKMLDIKSDLEVASLFQVTDCAKTLQVKGHVELAVRDLDDFGLDDLTHDVLESLCTWTAAQRKSLEKPELVLQVLLMCNEYPCARKWAAIHDASQIMLQVNVAGEEKIFVQGDATNLKFVRSKLRMPQIESANLFLFFFFFCR